MDLLTRANFIAVAILLLLIGIQDIRFRLIFNFSLGFLCVLIVSLSFVSGGVPNIILSLSALSVGFMLYICNILGAGDVKLIAVLALAFQSTQFYTFLFMTSLIGALLAIGGLIFFRATIKESGVPYGMAISLAFIFSYP